MTNNIYAIYKIHVVSKFSIPGDFLEHMMFPAGYSIQERFFEVGVLLNDETKEIQVIASTFDLDQLVNIVGCCKLCNENECYEIDEKERLFTLFSGDYQGNIVSKNELDDFVNGANNLNSLVKIIN